MRRRNFILGASTVALSGGAVFGSGAFTQSQVDRSVTLVVDDDADALLALSPGENEDDSSSGVAEVVQSDNGTNDQVELRFEENGSGVNVDGVAFFRDVLEVTNNGNEDVYIAAASQDQDEIGRSQSRRGRTRVLAADTALSNSSKTPSQWATDKATDISVESDFYGSGNPGADGPSYADAYRFALNDDGTPYSSGVKSISADESSVQLSFEFETGPNTRTNQDDLFEGTFRLKAFSQEVTTKGDLESREDVFVDDFTTLEQVR
jgi:hypothetical protein